MNVRDLAAGVICVGFDGLHVDDGLRDRLQSARLAGVILFARNVVSVEQTRALTDELRTCFETTPVLGIDQEGGRVARIRDGVVEIPSMMALAATGSTALARGAGEQTGADLRRVGVNIDFAPVLDLALHGANTVIGTRAFSDIPEVVAEFGAAFAAGLEDAGIVATYKHFPGHGATEVDSHLNLPVIDADEATVRARDLAPFTALLPAARAVMTAHIIVNAFDPHRPATNAKRLLTGVLREEIGFNGVCFTDCMQMDAIAKSVGTAGGAVLALQAGADCVLISHRFDLALESIDRIEAAVADGSLPLLRLQEAFERVQTLRASLSPPLALDTPAPHPGIGVEIGREAVTLIRGDIRARASECIAVSFEGTTTEGVQGTHAQHVSLRSYAAQLAEHPMPLEPQAAEVEALLHALREQNKRPILLSRRAHVYEAQAAAIACVLGEFPDAIVVSTREPFDIDLFAQAHNVVATFGDDAPSLAGLAAVLFEGAEPHGRFPVRWAAAR